MTRWPDPTRSAICLSRLLNPPHPPAQPPADEPRDQQRHQRDAENHRPIPPPQHYPPPRHQRISVARAAHVPQSLMGFIAAPLHSSMQRLTGVCRALQRTQRVAPASPGICVSGVDFDGLIDGLVVGLPGLLVAAQ